MRLDNLLNSMNLTELIESLIPDFVLGFAFFTSIVYAVLGRRFDRQRPAIAMSAAFGLALATGLVWWEKANDLSVKNLGPIAVGFAILVLSVVMYQAVRQIGGTWAGTGITIGTCILIAQLLQLNVPIDPQIIQTITVVALIVGILAFLSHTGGGRSFHLPRISQPGPNARRTMADRYRDRHLSDNLSKSMRTVRKEAANLNEHPQGAGNILTQLKRMLPAEGYLTERMAQLRAKAHQIKNGHIARLEETREVFADLPVSIKKKAAEELAARYRQLVDIDSRIERLDNAVAENEKRIRSLTMQAQSYTASSDYQKLSYTLKAAEKLQRHNTALFKVIEQTENKLSDIAKKIAQMAQRVNQP